MVESGCVEAAYCASANEEDMDRSRVVILAVYLWAVEWRAIASVAHFVGLSEFAMAVVACGQERQGIGKM